MPGHHIGERVLLSTYTSLVMSDRPYSSPLRDSQVQRTRDLILDALTELLSEQPSDQVSTREIAERAGVSQPTVYRHYPDRQALLEGLADRVTLRWDESTGGRRSRSLDDLAANASKISRSPKRTRSKRSRRRCSTPTRVACREQAARDRRSCVSSSPNRSPSTANESTSASPRLLRMHLFGAVVVAHARGVRDPGDGVGSGSCLGDPDPRRRDPRRQVPARLVAEVREVERHAEVVLAQ